MLQIDDLHAYYGAPTRSTMADPPFARGHPSLLRVAATLGAVDFLLGEAVRFTPPGLGAPRLLGVFADPDDEVFCVGGTLAKYTAAGAEAMVVSATPGQSGQIRDARAAGSPCWQTTVPAGAVRSRATQRIASSSRSDKPANRRTVPSGWSPGNAR